MKIIVETMPMARSSLVIKRVVASEKDKKEVARREFDAKGLALVNALREDLADVKKEIANLERR